MRGARTRDGLLTQMPPSIVMSRSSGIALSESRADLPRTTILMPAHLRGAKQGDGLTGRQWRRPPGRAPGLTVAHQGLLLEHYWGQH